MKELFKLGYDCYNRAKWVNSGESKNATYAVEQVDDTLVVTFQQTRSKTDLLTDLFFFPRKMGKISCLVHGGFWTQFDLVKDDIITCVRNAINHTGAKDVLIYGWSLGGAHALYLKLYLEYCGIKCKCVTIGAPRAFYMSQNWNEMQQNFKHTYCYVNGSDAVPYLPLGLFDIIKRVRVGKFCLIRFFTGQDHLQSSYYKSIMGE